MHTHKHTELQTKGAKGILEVMDIFITLIVMMVSQYMYVQTHQVVYIKSVPCFCMSVILQCSCKKKKEPENTLKFDYFYMFYEGKSGEI